LFFSTGFRGYDFLSGWAAGLRLVRIGLLKVRSLQKKPTAAGKNFEHGESRVNRDYKAKGSFP
jgi:hypothetical protein